MDIKNFLRLPKKIESNKVESNKTEKRHHIRLNTKNCVKITSPRMDLILKATKLKGVSLSEFCKIAALKEARLELLRYRKDRIEMAKKILKDEEIRQREKLL